MILTYLTQLFVPMALSINFVTVAILEEALHPLDPTLAFTDWTNDGHLTQVRIIIDWPRTNEIPFQTENKSPEDQENE